MKVDADERSSERHRKSLTIARQRKRKAGAAVAKKFRAAVDAIDAYVEACIEACDGSEPKRSDDQRLLLRRELQGFANFMENRYGP